MNLRVTIHRAKPGAVKIQILLVQSSFVNGVFIGVTLLLHCVVEVLVCFL